MNKYQDLLKTSYQDLHADKNNFPSDKQEEGIISKGIDIPIFTVANAKSDNERVVVDGRIEDESKQILNTFNTFLEKVFFPIMQEDVSLLPYATKNPDEMEYASLVNSLTRLFEIEMNRSIVPKIGEKRLSEHKSLPKPKKDESGVLSYMMGALLQVMGIYQNSEILPNEIRVLYKKFYETEFWSNFREDRNVASHYVIDEARFLNFYNSFCDLVKEGWFTELMNLKEELRIK